MRSSPVRSVIAERANIGQGQSYRPLRAYPIELRKVCVSETHNATSKMIFTEHALGHPSHARDTMPTPSSGHATRDFADPPRKRPFEYAAGDVVGSPPKRLRTDHPDSGKATVNRRGGTTLPPIADSDATDSSMFGYHGALASTSVRHNDLINTSSLDANNRCRKRVTSKRVDMTRSLRCRLQKLGRLSIHMSYRTATPKSPLKRSSAMAVLS